MNDFPVLILKHKGIVETDGENPFFVCGSNKLFHPAGSVVAMAGVGMVIVYRSFTVFLIVSGGQESAFFIIWSLI